MKKIKALLLIIGITVSFSFTILTGGNDPVEGIDIIVKIVPYPEKEVFNGEVNDLTIRQLNALSDEERSVFLSKYLATVFEEQLEEKNIEKHILKGLLQTRCSDCKRFETFVFLVPSKNKKFNYKVTIKATFDKKWKSIILNRTIFKEPVPNPFDDALNNEVNRLEAMIDATTRRRLTNQFKKVDFSKLKTKVDVYKSYLNLLNKNIPTIKRRTPGMDCLDGSGHCGTCDNCRTYPIEGIDDIIPEPIHNNNNHNKPVIKKNIQLKNTKKEFKKQ